MLADITNNRATQQVGTFDKDVTVSCDSPALLTSEAWDSNADLLPTKLKLKRAMASSSSPSAGRSSSPFGSLIGSHRFAPYEAPTSPSLDLDKPLTPSLLTSPTLNAARLPQLPSSPVPLTTAARLSLDATGLSSDSLESTTSYIEPTIVSINPQQTLSIERGTVMQFGRKVKRRAVAVQAFDKVDQIHSIVMPKHAVHASRLHCIVRLQHLWQDSDTQNQSNQADIKYTLNVAVLGQNGIKINGKRWRRGATASLPVKAGQHIVLDFYSWAQTIIVTPSELTTRHTSEQPSELHDMAPADDHDHQLEELDAIDEELSPALSALSDLASSPVRTNQQLTPQPNRQTSGRALELQNELALDLPGLIASAIVFSPRSTVGVEEVCRALLREVGAMWNVLQGDNDDKSDEREDQAIEQWWQVVEQVMLNEPFFGRIDNAGLKDASGHPLLPVYFYVPDRDPSASRVEALEPFVKRVRGARTTKPVQYFWAKPSLRKNR
ncbi:hypothetical protein OIO90_005949 [Microbotryomycetes sp. JL221]|nr:hypothetical protein OIO90_005949 [Microbotryomycetes sp. JL221]